jgi:hypothetical protein
MRSLHLFVLLWLTCGLAAQAPTDFSGAWSLVLPTRAAGAARGASPPGLSDPGDMGSGWGSELTITQDATTLRVTYTPFHPRDVQPPLAFSYRLDGAVSTNTVNMGRGPQVQESIASWRGSALAITTKHRFRDPSSGTDLTTETTQVLSLVPGDGIQSRPNDLVIEATRPGVLGGRSSTTRTVYRRR